MGTNTTLTANFVPNPFGALKGLYTGLIYDPDNSMHATSGFFSLKLTGQGAFSGKLIFAGRTLATSGRIGLDLHGQLVLPMNPGAPALRLEVQLSGGSDHIEGAVSRDAGTSRLEGFRSPFSAANRATSFAGRYTALLPGSTNASLAPFGDGFVTLHVSSNGVATILGALADGAPVTQSRFVAADGLVPFHSLPYQRLGSIVGWLALGSASNAVSGHLLWTKLGGAPGSIYPEGFVHELDTVGARYAAPVPPANPLGFEAGLLFLEGGNVQGILTNQLTLRALSGGKAAFGDDPRLSLTIKAADGTFRGSFLHPATGRPSLIKGAVLPREAYGGGFFLGTNQSGRASFGALLQ
jgi:hypothetical protein